MPSPAAASTARISGRRVITAGSKVGLAMVAAGGAAALTPESTGDGVPPFVTAAPGCGALPFAGIPPCGRFFFFAISASLRRQGLIDQSVYVLKTSIASRQLAV